MTHLQNSTQVPAGHLTMYIRSPGGTASHVVATHCCPTNVGGASTPRPVRSERHRWATVNHIHHNPVHHAYVKRWQDWPFSSAGQYLADIGRTEAERISREYPILDMGANWDPPEL